MREKLVAVAPVEAALAFLDDPGARPDVSARAAQEVDGHVRGGKAHLAVEAGGEREGHGRVGERREDAAVNGSGPVGELPPVRELDDRVVRLQLLQARLQPGQRGRGRQARPLPLEKIRGQCPGQVSFGSHTHKHFILRDKRVGPGQKPSPGSSAAPFRS